MKRLNFIVSFMLSMTTSVVFGQVVNTYDQYINQAQRHYKSSEYLKAAESYSKAFASNNNLGRIDHRYEAARCWAMAGEPDPAFDNLEKIANTGNFIKYYTIVHDDYLTSLHNDGRWPTLLALVKINKERIAPNLNEPLVAELDSIYTKDQKYRLQFDEIEKKYGWESNEMKAHWKTINEKNSVILIEIKSLLDKYGWLGTDVIGEQGNSTLFLVIQHSDIATQERYLPMMREAVKNGKAKRGAFALLEDRVALREGKKQIYGSQIGQDSETKLYYVSPLEDPDNVDKRRAEVGLQPLAEYVNQWQIKWDVRQYKKDLPTIEAKEKTLHR